MKKMTSVGQFQGQFTLLDYPSGPAPLGSSGQSKLVEAAGDGSENGCHLSASQTFPLADKGGVTICGQPRWSLDHLAEAASNRSDAEALALAYQEFGRDFLKHVLGPFSFAILDPDNKRMLAGIDRMGVGSLYYYQRDGHWYFGTTATAALEHPQASATLANQGLYNYVYFHMVPSPISIYEGLKKLPAGHLIEISEKGAAIDRYWSPAFQQQNTQGFSEAKIELKNQLRNAVQHSLSGVDRPGSFLSGGLDSSTVTGMLAELSNRKAPAYAIGFDEEGYDEMAFARATADHFGVPLQEYYVTPQDILDELPRIATSYDEPFGNSSALPAYFCAKKAQADGIDCLLAGDGGDEIFAGNSRYAKQKVFQVYSTLPGVLKQSLIEPLIALLPSALSPVRKLDSYITQANIPLPDRLQTYNYVNRMSAEAIFAPEFLGQVDTEEPANLQREWYHSLDDASDLSRMLFLDWQYTLADNDLKKVSRMCGLAGIDVQYPMLDDELVAFSCQIPDQWKLKRGDLRHFFKESLTGWLPDSTINKKKQGFGLPFGLWMQSYKPLNELAHFCIERLKNRGIFRVDFLTQLIQLHENDHAAYYGELIWVLTILDLWLEERI